MTENITAKDLYDSVLNIRSIVRTMKMSVFYVQMVMS